MYITPRVLIQQEFTQLPIYSESPLPAFVIGPNYALTRYSEPLEKTYTTLATLDGSAVATGNSYIYNTDTTYDIPNIPVAGKVDASYTKVFAEAVEAQYFPLTAIADTQIEDTAVTYVQSPSGANYTNRVRFENVVLKTANGYSRSEAFSNRDVSVNDVIELTDGASTVRAKVKTLLAETTVENGDLAATIAAVTLSGTDGVTNGASFSSASASFDVSFVGKYLTIQDVSNSSGTYKIVGVTNSSTVTLDRSAGQKSNQEWHTGGVYGGVSNSPKRTLTLDNSPVSTGTVTNTTATVTNASTGYVGYVAKGILSDTYTFTVTSSGDADGVRFSVSSQKGAFLTKTDLALTDNGGTYSLTVDDSSNNDVLVEFTRASQGTAMAFVLGNSWTVLVEASVTPISSYDDSITVGGEYTGSVDMAYTLRVERGGAFYDGTNSDTCARLVITASDIDTSKVVLPQSGESFNVGSYGVTAAIHASAAVEGLILGDVYYVPVTTTKAGAVTIVELSESLPEALLVTTPTLTAKLFLAQKSIQISSIRDLLTGETNWTQEESYITINSGITTYDNNLTSAGVPARLPVVSARLFVEHRDLLQDHATAINSVRSLADVSDLLGVVHPDNPLAQGVYDAVLNAANQIVYFIAVGSDDLAGYTEAIKISEKSDKVYSFVPLTFDRTIQDAVVAHVNAYSTPEVGRWRIAWLSVQDNKSTVLYDLDEEGNTYQGTITDDPTVSGTQYKLVTIEGASFIDDGIRANDSIRTNFRLNSDGLAVFDEYTIAQVRTNTTLVLHKPISTAINAPSKMQVVRNFTKTERASNIAQIGGAYNNRRVRCVFPDTYKYQGTTKQGYFAAAGLAGLRSGVVPHQGLTNSEFLGADDLGKVVLEFSQADLDTMAEQGVWLISQEVIGATAYVRHQLTTDTSGLNTSEDSITTNVDSISYALKKTVSPFIGKWNVGNDALISLRAAIVAELSYRATYTGTTRAGNQLTSFVPTRDIVRLEQNETYKDRVDVEVKLNVPYPMNYISLKLVV